MLVAALGFITQSRLTIHLLILCVTGHKDLNDDCPDFLNFFSYLWSDCDFCGIIQRDCFFYIGHFGCESVNFQIILLCPTMWFTAEMVQKIQHPQCSRHYISRLYIYKHCKIACKRPQGFKGGLSQFFQIFVARFVISQESSLEIVSFIWWFLNSSVQKCDLMVRSSNATSAVVRHCIQQNPQS